MLISVFDVFWLIKAKKLSFHHLYNNTSSVSGRTKDLRSEDPNARLSFQQSMVDLNNRLSCSLSFLLISFVVLSQPSLLTLPLCPNFSH